MFKSHSNTHIPGKITDPSRIIPTFKENISEEFKKAPDNAWNLRIFGDTFSNLMLDNGFRLTEAQQMELSAICETFQPFTTWKVVGVNHNKQMSCRLALFEKKIIQDGTGIERCSYISPFGGCLGKSLTIHYGSDDASQIFKTKPEECFASISSTSAIGTKSTNTPPIENIR